MFKTEKGLNMWEIKEVVKRIDEIQKKLLTIRKKILKFFRAHNQEW